MYQAEQPIVRRTTGEDRTRIALGHLVDLHGPELKITQARLAFLADTNRETANKALAVLARDGVVRLGVGRIIVFSREALR